MTTNAYRLYTRFTVDQLQEKRRAIEANPANQNKPGTLYRFTRPARVKLDAIAWAISYHMRERPATPAPPQPEEPAPANLFVFPGRSPGPMEVQPNGRPPSDIAGLRNTVRQIIHAAEAAPGGKDAEATLQLYGLLDDLRSSTVFTWR